MITFCLIIKLFLLRIGEGSAQHSSISHVKPLTQNVIVSMKSSTIPIINSIDKKNLSRDEVATILAQKLKLFSAKSQSQVISVLERFGAEYQAYWITNQLYIKDANPALIKSLKGLPQVRKVAKEKVISLHFIFDREFGIQPNGTEWHLRKMEVEKVWMKTRGEGIIVASIDSGVRASHEALIDNYIGTDNYGWYDPASFKDEPEDLLGHGTHVVGIIAGANGIGVAPHSKWMACRAGINVLMHEHAIIACAQFVLCPNYPSGQRNCTGVPHIVSNSWGRDGGGSTWFEEIVMAWNKAGIKPFFAVGNEGPDCKTAASPADYDDVIAVGSTDLEDRLDESSSRGPVIKYDDSKDGSGDPKEAMQGLLEGLLSIGKTPIPTDKIKPDIVAPGVDINSAFILTDRSYFHMTGTSMAAPAAAGVAALLLSIKPGMSLKELKNLLQTTTDKNFMYTNSEQCGGIPEDKFPNNLYGHGRVNAFSAYKKLESKIKAEKAAKK